MREVQIANELANMKQTSSAALMEHLEVNKSNEVLESLIDLVEKGIEDYHNSVQKKRAAFFSVTKGMEFRDVAFVGLKAVFGIMGMTQSMAVVTIGKRVGEMLLIANGRADEMYSIEEKVVKDKTSAGIRLLDIVVESLNSNFFRATCERLGATKTQWSLDANKGFDKFREENPELFEVFTRRLMPLVCQPDDWTNMNDGGYLTEIGKKVNPLVKKMTKHMHPEGTEVFDAINHLQRTPFRINKKILQVCLELAEVRPAAMKKLFQKDIGRFEEEYPVSDGQSYIWEKEEGLKEDPKTGKAKKAMVMVHTDDNSVALRKEAFKWRAKKAYHKKLKTAKKSIDRSYATTLEVVQSLKDVEELFWAYSLDRRSRVYPSAMTGINLQGADYQKACVEFEVGVPIGDEDGVYAIKKTLTNHWGNDSGNGVKTDKLTRKQTEKWMIEASRWIVACAEDPMVNTKWMGADKPLQFLVACFEWADWLAYQKENPNSYGFISRLCDPNDASCSGAQILSAMTRDDNGAMHTNLKDMPVQDLYMACAKKTTEILMNTIKEGGEDKQMAQDWLGRANIIEAIKEIIAGEQNEILTDVSHELILKHHDKGLSVENIYEEVFFELTDVERDRLSLIIRNLVKKPVMVKFYSGTRYGNIEHCNEFIVEKGWEGNFRADSIGSVASYMGNTIYDAINQVISGAGLVMEWFVHVAEVLGNAGKAVKWTTPVGFKASMSKHATKDVRITVPFAGNSSAQFTLKIPVKVATEDGWAYKLDVKKMKSGIAPDIVHSLDASLIMKVAARCAKEGILHLLMIHDSLGSHCALSSKFNRIIREEFVKMFEEDILGNLYEEFKSQLNEEDQDKLKSPEQFGIFTGTYDLKECLQSEFCFR